MTVGRDVVVPPLDQKLRIELDLTEAAVTSATIAGQGKNPSFNLFTEDQQYISAFPQGQGSR